MAFTDNFTGTDGADIAARTGWSGTANAWIINTNAAKANSAAQDLIKCTDQASANHYTQVVNKFANAGSASFACIRATDGNNWIGMRASSGAYQAFWYQSGFNLIGSYSVTCATGDVMYLEADGSNNVTFKLNTTTRIGPTSVTFNATETRQGLLSRAVEGPLYDDFEAGALSAGGATGALSSAGSATGIFTGSSTATSAISAAGAATATFTGSSRATGDLNAAGSGTATFTASSRASGDLSGAGAGTATFTAASTARGDLNALGTATVAFEGASFGQGAAAFSAAGTSTASFAGASISASTLASAGSALARFVGAGGSSSGNDIIALGARPRARRKSQREENEEIMELVRAIAPDMIDRIRRLQ